MKPETKRTKRLNQIIHNQEFYSEIENWKKRNFFKYSKIIDKPVNVVSDRFQRDLQDWYKTLCFEHNKDLKYSRIEEFLLIRKLNLELDENNQPYWEIMFSQGYKEYPKNTFDQSFIQMNNSIMFYLYKVPKEMCDEFKQICDKHKVKYDQVEVGKKKK